MTAAPGGAAPGKRVTVAFARPDRQYLWPLELPDEATVGDALAAAQRLAARAGEGADIPWAEANVGIFGEPCGRGDIPRDGDRVEIYRPLLSDPKERRRQQARRR